MNKSIYPIVMALIAMGISFAVNAQVQGDPLVFENVEVHKFESAVVHGQVYELRVALPADYYQSPDKEYPVLVVMDGQWSFTLAAEIAGNLAQDGMIPESIVVGVTWGGEGDDPNLLRTRDYIRPAVPYIPQSGGAGLFLEALTDELVPHVESLYRVGDKRVLLGVSLGGLFVSYAMLEEPGYFDGYLSVAGSYFVDNTYLEDKLAAMSGTKDLKRVRSFVSVGSLDTNEYWVDMFHSSVKSAHLRGFKQKYKVFKGVGHAGVEPLAFTYGLQYIFKRPFLKLSEDFLQRYAGVYEGGPEGFPPFPVTVSVVGKGTIGVGDEYEQTEYIAESESKFYILGSDDSIEFTDDFRMIINSRGTLLYFDRVD